MTRRLLLVMVASVFAVAGVGVPTAHAADEPATAAERALASCLQRSHHLLVVFDVDRSGSIASTDPDGLRVDGLEATLMGLERLADDTGETSGRKTHVEVLLASFASSFDPPAASVASQWRTLDAKSLNPLLRSVAEDADRDTGRDTDYVLALSAARAALRARASSLASAGQPMPCKLILFVTDGRYELTEREPFKERQLGTPLPVTVPYAPGVRLDRPGGPARAQKRGHHILCDSAGLMDQIADEGTVLFTVALSASGLDFKDLGFLQSLTTGVAPGQTCGSDVNSASGEFINVQDSYSLFLVFATLPGGHVPILHGCPDGPCSRWTQVFRVEPGVAGFLLDASDSSPDFGVKLTGPTGATTTVAPDAPTHTVVSAAEVQQRWVRSRSVEAQVSFSTHDRSWSGTWRLTFFGTTDGDLSSLQHTLRLRSSIRPRLVGQPSVARGKTTLVGIELADGADAALREGPLARSARVRAWVPGADGRLRSVRVDRLPDGRFRASVPGGQSDRPVRLDVEVSFVGYGEAVEPVNESFRLPRPTSHLVLLILGSVLVLLLVLAIVARVARRVAAARFPPREVLRVLALDVQIVPNRSVVSDPPRERVRFSDLEQLANDGSNRRSWSVQHDVFRLRARARPRYGFSSPGEARADRVQPDATKPGAAQLVGGTLDGPLASFGDHRVCEVPLALSGTWLFAVQRLDDAGELRGRLLLISDEAQEPDHGERLFAAARAALFVQEWDEFERVQDGNEEESLMLSDRVQGGPLDWSEL